MRILANAGYITKVGEDDTGDRFGMTVAQEKRFLAVLADPSSWGNDPVLLQCLDALDWFRREFIIRGELPGE